MGTLGRGRLSTFGCPGRSSFPLVIPLLQANGERPREIGAGTEHRVRLSLTASLEVSAAFTKLRRYVDGIDVSSVGQGSSGVAKTQVSTQNAGELA